MFSGSATTATPGMVDQIAAFIRERGLRHGDRLPPIRELATQFGVKAGLVRDALLDAQGRGLVRIMPRAGAFVETVSASPSAAAPAERLGDRLRDLLAAQNQNLFHLLDAREVLEVALISQAARRRELEDLFPLHQILQDMAAVPAGRRDAAYFRLDMEFHLEIARLSGNAVLAAMLCTVMEDLAPHLSRLDWSAQRHRETDASHFRLYSALVSADETAAESEVRSHLRHAYRSLLDHLVAGSNAAARHGSPTPLQD